jgi:hypothetical protein
MTRGVGIVTSPILPSRPCLLPRPIEDRGAGPGPRSRFPKSPRRVSPGRPLRQLFAFLAFGVAARSFLLCWSMQHVERTDPEQFIFGPYFLVPFLLSVAVLLLEIGLVARADGIACLLALSGRIAAPASVPPWAVSADAPAIAALLAGYGQWLRHRPSRIAAALVVAHAGWRRTAGGRTTRSGG